MAHTFVVKKEESIKKIRRLKNVPKIHIKYFSERLAIGFPNLITKLRFVALNLMVSNPLSPTHFSCCVLLSCPKSESVRVKCLVSRFTRQVAQKVSYCLSHSSLAFPFSLLFCSITYIVAPFCY